MSYANLTKVEVKVVPQGTPKVVKNCPKCGGGSHFVNSGKFRVNANKKYLDIWLIYQCEKCKSTWNMTLYERMNPTSMDNLLLERLMTNDEGLVMIYGSDSTNFKRNFVTADYGDVIYTIDPLDVDRLFGESDQVCISFSADYELPVKIIKVIAQVLDISVSKTKRLYDQGTIECDAKKFSKEKLGRGKEVTIHAFGRNGSIL